MEKPPQHPETRSTFSCVYAPRATADPADQSPPKGVAVLEQQVLVKQFMLATVFADPATAAAVIDHVRQSPHDAPELARAVTAMHAGDVRTVSSALASVPIERVAAFADAALTAERDLIAAGTVAVAGLLPGTVPTAVTVDHPSLADAAAAAAAKIAHLPGLAQPTAAAPVIKPSSAVPVATPIAVELAKQINPAVRYLQATGVVETVDGTATTLPVALAPGWSQYLDARQRRVVERRQALDALRGAARQDRIGFLYLERLDFAPMRYLRGDLVHSVTLLPGETVRLQHREWSRTEKEFASLVATTTETEREEALAEKSELAHSSTTQQTHQIALSAAVSAGSNFGVFNVQANAGFTFSDQKTRTETESEKHQRELTKRAASRAKQEHKVTFRSVSQWETEEISSRELTNTATEAIRWDFHRMVREWRVGLYRYGARMAYDLTIPEPGSYLLRVYRELADLRVRMEAPAPVLTPSAGLTTAGAARQAAALGVTVDAAPEPQQVASSRTVTYAGRKVGGSATVDLPIPEGYRLVRESVSVEGAEATRRDAPEQPRRITSRIDPKRGENTNLIGDGAFTGTYPWIFGYEWFNDTEDGATLTLHVRATVTPLAPTTEVWRSRTHAILAEAQATRHQQQVDAARQRHDALLDQLAAVDTLQLRQLEREEVIKGALRWMLGPTFNFYPPSLPHSQQGAAGDLDDPRVDEVIRGIYSGDRGTVSDDATWQATLGHGQLITFLHTAIEWENVNFVLYPYFWTDHERWDFKQRLTHADSDHLQFLRSGAARIVLTIRPGFEESWLHFVDTGQLPGSDLRGSAYQAIADQVRAAADTYAAYRPSANEPTGELIAQWTEWTPTGALDVARGEPLAVAGADE
ncbi:hypothetical protein F4553_001765 [Allocatelliglobosispora scoriae]|uniref:Uncharacterized protein n=1 Tax=Allocatelliglobosispora scoriae TaxID=643052 RepID=A0A841BMB0_9ACTN|nr:hypothetical protein [Allocatelliglobosispora scoriae]MBB5868386.1 hypothetical protein [Allocatelliglobosispora scoriae]